MKFNYINLKVGFFALIFNIFALSLCQSAGMDYLIYKNNLEPVDQAEHAAAYDIISRYQFPACLEHEEEFKRELGSPEALRDYASNEHAWLEKKIQETSPDIKLLPIPTTMYELLWLNIYARKNAHLNEFMDQRNEFLHSKREALVQKNEENLIELMRERAELCDLSVLSFFMPRREDDIRWNGFKRIKYLFHFYLNLEMLNYLREKLGQMVHEDAGLDGLDSREYSQMIRQHSHALMDSVINEFNSFFINQDNPSLEPDWNALFDNYKTQFLCKFFSQVGRVLFIDEADKALLNKSVDVEYEGYDNGCFVLYRGSDGYEERLDKIIKRRPRGGMSSKEGDRMDLSYGNSLFSGMISDRDASAFYCMNFRVPEPNSWSPRLRPSKRVYAYCILMNKFDYFQSTSTERRLFCISPWSTFEGLWACGEVFHSRTNPDQAKPESSCFCGSEPCQCEELFQDFLLHQSRLIR